MLIKQEETIKFSGQTSYYVVKKVEPVMDHKLEEGIIFAERVFKGAKMPGLVVVDDETWHTDWQLVPKHEESKYMIENPPEFQPAQVEKKSFDVPPLMDAFLKRHYRMKGVQVSSETITIPLNYKPSEIDYGVDRSKQVKFALSGRFRNRNKQS